MGQESRSGGISRMPRTIAELLRSYADSFQADDEGLTLAPENWNNLRQLLIEAADALTPASETRTQEPHLLRVIPRDALQNILRQWRAGEPYPEGALGTEGCAVSACSDPFSVKRAEIIEECVKVAQENLSKIGSGSWNAFHSAAQDGARQAAARIAEEIRELKE